MKYGISSNDNKTRHTGSLGDLILTGIVNGIKDAIKHLGKDCVDKMKEDIARKREELERNQSSS